MYGTPPRYEPGSVRNQGLTFDPTPRPRPTLELIETETGGGDSGYMGQVPWWVYLVGAAGVLLLLRRR